MEIKAVLRNDALLVFNLAVLLPGFDSILREETITVILYNFKLLPRCYHSQAIQQLSSSSPTGCKDPTEIMRPQIPPSICPSCLFRVAAAARLPATTSITNPAAISSVAAQRLFSGRPRPAPSRMVLSDRERVSRGRDDSKPRRSATPGPFGGMNRTKPPTFDPARPGFSKRPPNRPTSGARDRERGGDKKDERRTKAMKMQNALTAVSYGQRTRTKAAISELDSFDQLPLGPAVKEAISGELLKGMVDLKPTPVQRLAIPTLLGEQLGRKFRSSRAKPAREEFLIAAETGSGKTLAYLLPVVHAIKEAEAADPAIQEYREYFAKQMEAMNQPDYTGPNEFEPHPTAARPKAIILVPTAELVDQVGIVTKALSHAVKFKAARFSADVSAKVINRDMYAPGGIDLIVATPHLLASMADSDPNILSRVSHLVIDEADSLFDRSFSPVTTSILDRALPSLKQLILCSATIPKRLDNLLSAQFPDMHRITTPNLHAIPRRVQLGVIDVSKDPYRNNKDLACADAIWSIGKDAARHETRGGGGADDGEMDVKRIMVFVNEREKTQEVADYLRSKGIDAVALHRDTPEQRQSEMLSSFTTREPMTTARPTNADAITAAIAGTNNNNNNNSSPKPQPPSGGGSRRSLPNTKVIVATDLASRGIDTLAVRHVILYDVPHTTVDFIHRLGRAGRMGRRGRGIVLVGRADRRDIVAEVRESMYMGQALI
ncbi:P-loop containing nucleoside triphosphate hydrolase protein [Microdochium bolleyi]|uniref:RNA helicase n=1 Tax=Microdochium bolleyi TaxID=196109 RepID=A0A136JBE3_9PEZI|nr:P-loop containing nucleoside triphosphate hydrolase protein [Microdochium bolleyi]